MVFKRFGIIILMRTLVLCVSVFALFYLITDTSLYATTFIVGIIIIFEIFSLINYVQKTNRDIARFFNSIRYSDFSQSFKSSVKGSAFEELSGAFSEVMEEFRKARTEKEEHYRYMQTIVQHVGVGLMAFTPDGEIDMINTAAKKLLKIHGAKNIKELSVLSKNLVESLFNIKAGDKILIKVAGENELSQLSIYAAEFKMREKHFTLVSISNIQSELEEKEMEAWQNLIRVLTHEIMNSVTPIVSLSSTVNDILGNSGGGLSEETVSDIKGAVGTIQRRSKGLIHFVDDYRNLTKIPVPNFQNIKVSSFFDRATELLKQQLESKEIKITAETVPADLEVTADPDLIDQVLINLVVNAINAVENAQDPWIKLAGRIDPSGSVIIQVTDNGKGIPEELYEKIFIPFFTTKKEGSGIGLSLSKQIMRVHKGGISVSSAPGKETIFTLKF